MRRCGASITGLLLLTGCQGVQSVTAGDGLEGAWFNNLLTLFLIICGIAYLLVILFLAVALLRRREPQERFASRGLIGWIAFILIGLTVLTVGSFLTDRSSAALAKRTAPVQIEVTANQFWWDVTYLDQAPYRQFRTANELHLPVGTSAHVTLKSNDVIHSFWIPNLAGKQDLIPGRETDILLNPQRSGTYRGQCAEFCGAQHAHMALDVVVEPKAVFERWKQRQLAPAPEPASPLAIAGRDYVAGRECSVCHAISGTSASGKVAPDLTHLASRRSIGAGTFPMQRGYLYAWVADPQGAKPGNRMPYIGLQPRELHAVVAYLETLK